MAKLVFAMNMSLDGYVDHDAFAPVSELFAHFIEQTRGLSGSLYGRRMYETMRYWDHPDGSWGPAERDYADAWRQQPKYVVSRTLKEVGPNATLVKGDPETFARDLKAGPDGEVLVAGPELAQALAPLIDEYQIYLHPAVVGAGKPFFAGARPALRLLGAVPMPGDVLRLTYAPA